MCFSPSLSYLPWFEIYYKLLNTLADYLTTNQENELNDMLNSLYSLPVPKPFTPVNLSVVGTRNLTEYFVAVDVNNMLQLYASMLHERRIIITSSKLSTLTACVHGSAAMLYPMYWQHIYIPVLPPHLLDYCCAPMPYLVGVHLSLLERVRSRSLEDVVILNVDTNTLESPQNDLQNLPSDVLHSLKSKLKKQSTATGSGVARSFLRAQAALFGSYRDALRYKPGEPITFCEESFVAHRSSTMKHFLEMAVNLQLFKQFIDGRLAKLNAGRGFTDLFEDEITEGGFCGSEWHFTTLHQYTTLHHYTTPQHYSTTPLHYTTTLHPNTTLLHHYTTPLHYNTTTLLHHYTARLHYYTTTLLQPYTTTPLHHTSILHYCTTTLHYYYTTTLLHHYTTLLHHYSTPLHYYTTTLHHYCTIAPLHYTTTPLHYYTTTLHHYTTPLHRTTAPHHYTTTPLHYYTTTLHHTTPLHYHYTSILHYYYTTPLHHYYTTPLHYYYTTP
uniref:DENN domain containing 1B n=1 Tax=Oncorhynchus kisutch TaxID=8019 RepID=A0A8C7IYA7_ONCKI